MIKTLIYKAFDHGTKLETMIKQMDKKKFAQTLFIFTTMYTMSKVIRYHDEKIEKLEKEIKELKSKGE